MQTDLNTVCICMYIYVMYTGLKAEYWHALCALETRYVYITERKGLGAGVSTAKEVVPELQKKKTSDQPLHFQTMVNSLPKFPDPISINTVPPFFSPYSSGDHISARD